MSDDSNSQSRKFRNPDLPPSGPENGEGNEFDELLSGMLDLTSAEGNVSGSEFVLRIIEEMNMRELGLDDFRMRLIVKYGFGDQDDVSQRIAGMSDEELAEAYPDRIGELLKWYTEPSED